MPPDCSCRVILASKACAVRRSNSGRVGSLAIRESRTASGSGAARSGFGGSSGRLATCRPPRKRASPGFSVNASSSGGFASANCIPMRWNSGLRMPIISRASAARSGPCRITVGAGASPPASIASPAAQPLGWCTVSVPASRSRTRAISASRPASRSRAAACISASTRFASRVPRISWSARFAPCDQWRMGVVSMPCSICACASARRRWSARSVAV